MHNEHYIQVVYTKYKILFATLKRDLRAIHDWFS